jgi:hypothetical protein
MRSSRAIKAGRCRLALRQRSGFSLLSAHRSAQALRKHGT